MVRGFGSKFILALAVVLSVACLASTSPALDDDARSHDARFSLNSLANYIRDGMKNKLPKEELQAKAGLDCTGKPDGNYPDPVDQCSGSFYMCTNQHDEFFDCALQGTVFDPSLDRCEYCQFVYPCNADPNNIRCPTGGGGRPTCPPYDPSIYVCVCGASSCQLQLISTTPRPAPTCPPYDPNVYICVCGATSCNLELIKPTCPPYDPNVYICVCGASSCQLQLITTTAPPKPTCPPFDPNVYICVCGATSCNLELIKPTCPPYDPNVYICVCGATSCQLQLITTTARPAPTCPPFDPNVYVCVCGISSCNLELKSTLAPTGGPTAPCPGRTIGTTPSNSQLSCAGKPDGNYPDPFDPCSGGFYMCTNGIPEYFICALQGTVFDPAQDRCDYCNVVAGCNTFAGHHLF